MNLRDLLTIALNQDISVLVRVDAVGPQYQAGYMAGMRRAIEILDNHPLSTPTTITQPASDDGTGC